MCNSENIEKNDTLPATPVISYHTFIFPFLWKIGKNGKSVSLKDFEKCKHPGWQEDLITEMEKRPEHYAQLRYFNPAARSAIYDNGEENGIVRNYRFDMQKLSSTPQEDNTPVHFVIKNTVTNETEDEQGQKKKTKESVEYDLIINAFRLKFYNTGIGLLIYELENYTYSEQIQINRINDWGRRLYMPFVKDDGSCHLCAESITVRYGKNQNIWTSVISGAAVDTGRIDLPQFVTNLLTSDEYTITTIQSADEVNGKKAFYIEPVIGDRMFVACIYENKEWISMLGEWKDGKYVYMHDALNKAPAEKDNLAAQLYKFVFVDGNGLSCYNRQMLHNLLDDHIYARWLEEGSISGITEYSMVTLTNCSEFTSVPFLTQYIEMICIAIAQRSSLLVFERLISDSALEKQQIIEVQQKYIMFQSQLLLQEVTPEQQGIELYDELIESLFIERESEQIENQISALFDRKNYENDKTESNILFMLAILGVAELVDIVSGPLGWQFWVAFILIVVFLAVLFVYPKIKHKIAIAYKYIKNYLKDNNK